MSVLSDALARVFRLQRRQYRALEKERFGDWNGQLMQAILPAIRAAYPKTKDQIENFNTAARNRARELAKEINATTGRMLTEGRDEESIFGEKRSNGIAYNELKRSRESGKIAVNPDRKVTWTTGGWHVCDWCRSKNGRSVMAGGSFGIRDGVAIRNPPAHPNCKCKLRVK